ALVVVALFGQVSDETPFRPYTHANYAFVNAVAFSPDGTSLFHASFLGRVARHRGQTLAPGAPELGIFESRRGTDGTWGEPALLPFSGRDKDYEPTLSPDGQFMIFNSWRPLPSGPPNRDGRNNLWLSRRRAGGWSDPVSLAGINRPETEESYAAIASDGRIFYVQEVGGKPGGEDWDIYVTRLDGDRASAPTPVAVAATDAGEGDPWVAPDGSYLIFTRWDRAADWQTSVDLYITFARGMSWTTPVPLAELNQPNAPEYAVTITNDLEPMLYFRRGGPMVMRPARPVIERARAAVVR
ncbi:MAG TPA: sialidase family protein, partial [Vicinamibacterales bacterium]|nr:sialidase family protein [Vicinamibacterales bacterium]